MSDLVRKLSLAVLTASFLFCFSLSALAQSSSGVETAPTNHHEIVIIGGGIAGLTCGYFLKDKDFILLEEKGAVGGRAVAGNHKSFTYAKGTEYLGAPESHLAQMIDELDLDVKEIPSPMDAYFDGRSFYYGSEGIKRYLVKKSSFAAYRKFIKLIINEYNNYDELPEINYNSRIRNLDNLNARQWLMDNGIPDVFIKKYNVTTKGLFGAPLEEISALSLIPEAAFDYDKSDLRAGPPEKNPDLDEEYAEAKSESSGSFSFIKGVTELTDKLGEALGNKIKLNSKVVSVDKENDGYVVAYVEPSGQKFQVTANKVVLAVPSPIALKIASSVISEEKKEIMRTIHYAPYATVAFFSDTPIFDKAFDLAVPDDYFFTDVYDATWVERFYDNKSNGYIISVYVAPKASGDHSLTNMSDQEMIAQIYEDLDKIFESASSKITGYDIERFTYGYPVMSLGAYQRLLMLNELNHGSLILAGDYLVYPTFEGAVQSGYLAAEKIKKGQ